jgi:hypothetical protein
VTTASAAPTAVWQIEQTTLPPTSTAAAVTWGAAAGAASGALQRGQRIALSAASAGARTLAPHWQVMIEPDIAIPSGEFEVDYWFRAIVSRSVLITPQMNTAINDTKNIFLPLGFP